MVRRVPSSVLFSWTLGADIRGISVLVTIWLSDDLASDADVSTVCVLWPVASNYVRVSAAHAGLMKQLF